jgi:4'-phosphopantetheinyl transferase EntD
LDIDFAETQVTGLIIDSAEEAISPAKSEPIQENIQPEGGIQDEVSLGDGPRMPFIGKVLHYIANREIVIERNLDLTEDLFLQDHIFLYADGIKPISAQLPVLPMTVGMEMLAEVAACLAPGYGLIRFENIRAKRWIELVHAERLTLRTSAHLDYYDEGSDTYRIVVDLFIEKETKPALQATVLFGRSYQVNVELGFSHPKNPIRYPLSPKQIYEERIMFHGPNFQSLSGDTVLAERSVVGELSVLPKSDMFYSTPQPEMLTDPNLLDGVGQLIGLWAIEKNVYVFPIGIQKLEIYCPTPAVNTRVPVIVEINHYNSKLLKADVEVQDGAGHVWMRIQEWGDWVFKWPKKAYNFRRKPTKYCTSHGLVMEGLPNGAVAQRISKADMRDLALHHMAGFYLHMDEMPTFWALQEVPNRQFQWLIGRIAAKDAVRRWLTQDKTREMLHPAAFTIENDEKRRPVIKNLPGDLESPRLSISHSKDRAVALVHSDAIGIDIEKIVDRDESFLKTIASQEEIKLLGDLLDSEPAAWVTRLWCAKEASGKLMDTGLDGSPQQFEAIDINVGGIITIFHHNSGRSVFVHTKQEGDFTIAYAAGPPA